MHSIVFDLVIARRPAKQGRRSNLIDLVVDGAKKKH